MRPADVVRLHVAVDDAVPAAVVEVGQAPGDAHGDLVPGAPVQEHAAAALEQVDVEGPVRHVLVDEEPALALAAEAHQPHQVDVLDDADGAHFSSELLLSLEAHVQPLHRDGGGVAQLPLEDGAEATLPELFGEIFGRGTQLSV